MLYLTDRLLFLPRKVLNHTPVFLCPLKNFNVLEYNSITLQFLTTHTGVQQRDTLSFCIRHYPFTQPDNKLRSSEPR